MDILREMEMERASGKKIYDMAVGNVNLPIPPRLIGGLSYAMNDGAQEYSPALGIYSLREKIYPKFPEQVIIGNGTKELISLLAKTWASREDWLDEKNEILIIGPTWPFYSKTFFDAGFKISQLDLDCSKDIIRQISKKINTKTLAIVLCNPNNPTGLVLNLDELTGLHKIVCTYNLQLIVDETYYDYVYEGNFYSMLGVENTYVFRSFSKSYAIPGWRFGYMVGPLHWVEQMGLYRAKSFSGSPSTLVQKAVDYCYGNILETGYINEMRERRDRIAAALGKCIVNAGKNLVSPSAGFYFFVRVNSAEATLKELRSYGIYAMDGTNYLSIDNDIDEFGRWIRLAFSNVTLEELDEICPILKRVFDK